MKNYALHAVIVHKPVTKNKLESIREHFINSRDKHFIRETPKSFRIRNHPKQRFENKSFRTKVVNKQISLVFGELKPQYHKMVEHADRVNPLKGAGVIDYFRKKLGDVSGAIKSVRDYFTPRLDGYNNKSTATIKKYGERIVKSMQVYKTPLSDKVNTFLNLLSFGKLSQVKKKYGFDEFFHLALVCNIGDRNIMLQKNSVVDITEQYKTTPLTQIFNIDTHNKQFTINEMLNKTRERMGDKAYFEYDMLTHNCQNYVCNLLESVGLLSVPAKEFIYQNISEIIKEIPAFSKYLIRGATDLDALINKLTGGTLPHLDLEGYGMQEQFDEFIKKQKRILGLGHNSELVKYGLPPNPKPFLNGGEEPTPDQMREIRRKPYELPLNPKRPLLGGVIHTMPNITPFVGEGKNKYLNDDIHNMMSNKTRELTKEEQRIFINKLYGGMMNNNRQNMRTLEEQREDEIIRQMLGNLTARDFNIGSFIPNRNLNIQTELEHKEVPINFPRREPIVREIEGKEKKIIYKGKGKRKKGGADPEDERKGDPREDNNIYTGEPDNNYILPTDPYFTLSGAFGDERNNNDNPAQNDANERNGMERGGGKGQFFMRALMASKNPKLNGKFSEVNKKKFQNKQGDSYFDIKKAEKISGNAVKRTLADAPDKEFHKHLIDKYKLKSKIKELRGSGSYGDLPLPKMMNMLSQMVGGKQKKMEDEIKAFIKQIEKKNQETRGVVRKSRAVDKKIGKVIKNIDEKMRKKNYKGLIPIEENLVEYNKKVQPKKYNREETKELVNLIENSKINKPKVNKPLKNVKELISKIDKHLSKPKMNSKKEEAEKEHKEFINKENSIKALLEKLKNEKEHLKKEYGISSIVTEKDKAHKYFLELNDKAEQLSRVNLGRDLTPAEKKERSKITKARSEMRVISINLDSKASELYDKYSKSLEELDEKIRNTRDEMYDMIQRRRRKGDIVRRFE